MTLWEQCRGERHIQPLRGSLYRLVESQEQIATLGYVDTLAEQALLEDMLEAAKPTPAAAPDTLHYLLSTPFRYPPLPWGSRFGRRHELGIFYGGIGIAATLAEAAYYRFVFWQSMAAPPVKDRMHTEHTLFSADYATRAGVRLQAEPFSAHEEVLAHAADYAATQAIGGAMRAAGVETFEYRSARDPQRGCCAGLFTPSVFTAPAPQALCQWFCEVSARRVSFRPFRSFRPQHSTPVYSYPFEDFLLGSTLPLPTH